VHPSTERLLLAWLLGLDTVSRLAKVYLSLTWRLAKKPPSFGTSTLFFLVLRNCDNFIVQADSSDDPLEILYRILTKLFCDISAYYMYSSQIEVESILGHICKPTTPAFDEANVRTERGRVTSRDCGLLNETV
jgi:hypothetical protein